MKLLNLCPFKVGDKVSYGGHTYGGMVLTIEDRHECWYLWTDDDLGMPWQVRKGCKDHSGMRLWEGKNETA